MMMREERGERKDNDDDDNDMRGERKE